MVCTDWLIDWLKGTSRYRNVKTKSTLVGKTRLRQLCTVWRAIKKLRPSSTFAEPCCSGNHLGLQAWDQQTLLLYLYSYTGCPVSGASSSRPPALPTIPYLMCSFITSIHCWNSVSSPTLRSSDCKIVVCPWTAVRWKPRDSRSVLRKLYYNHSVTDRQTDRRTV